MTPRPTTSTLFPYTTLFRSKTIHLEKDSIRKEVEGKVVLVTGAAGSIGSEISRQLLSYPCKKIVLLDQARSEEHTSELQSRFDLVCRLLLEKKKTHIPIRPI